jgi:hypothetical protein
VSEPSNEILESLRAIKRRWMSVVVAVVAVAAVAALYAWRTTPSADWMATARVRVSNALLVPYVYETPPPGAFIGMVATPQVRDAAGATLGVDPSTLGAFTATIDTADQRVILVTAHGSTREAAERAALAVAGAARAKTMDLIRPAIEFQQRLVREETPRVESMRSRAEAITASGRPVDAQSADTQALSAEKGLAESAFLVATYDLLVTPPELQSATHTTSTRYFASTVAQGLVVGLFIGVLGAVLLDRRARRRG